ncbi:MAG: ABC transporter permease subunit [Candidatus Bathyarchaeia archaeon]
MLVLLPTVFLASFPIIYINDIVYEVFENPLIGNENLKLIAEVLIFSFKLSALTVFVDIILGIPLAFMLARANFPGKLFLETLVTLPLVIPTSGFGFASLLTWTTASGIGKWFGLSRGVLSIASSLPFIDVPIIVFIVHVTLTLPYVVRTVQAKLGEIDVVYEDASRTLGATSLTTFRKILIPELFPAIFSGSVLAFARSLGETGATLIVAGVRLTAAVAVVKWEFEFKLGTAAFLGLILVAITWLIILPVELFLMGAKGGVIKPPSIVSGSAIESLLIRLEVKLSKRSLKNTFYGLCTVILLVLTVTPIIVVIESVFNHMFKDPYTGKTEGSIIYQLFGPANYFPVILKSTAVSFVSAFSSTYISVFLSIPLVYIIDKYKFGKVLRAILKIPLVIPSSALGLSMLLLWGPKFLGFLTPGIWLIILTQIVFSVPVIVETTMAVYEGSNIKLYEDAAKTLGANPYHVIEKISLPILKEGIITGAILSFTHSLGETGAAMIVMGADTPISVLVVNMVESLAIPAALFTSAYLILISMVMMIVFRIVSRRRRI